MHVFLKAASYTGVVDEKSVADLGFPRAGGANLLFGIILLVLKLHEDEKNWARKGRASLTPPGSATEKISFRWDYVTTTTYPTKRDYCRRYIKRAYFRLSYV